MDDPRVSIASSVSGAASAATGGIESTTQTVFRNMETIMLAQPVVPTALLFVLLLFAFTIMLKAQKRKDFDWADMLKDDDGKVSSTRMFSFICLAVTSWIVAYLTISDKLTEQYYWYYLVIWSGTAVALKMIDKWNGTLPFSRGALQDATNTGAAAAALGAAAATGNPVPQQTGLP